jgi:hypothetical protein
VLPSPDLTSPTTRCLPEGKQQLRGRQLHTHIIQPMQARHLKRRHRSVEHAVALSVVLQKRQRTSRVARLRHPARTHLLVPRVAACAVHGVGPLHEIARPCGNRYARFLNFSFQDMRTCVSRACLGKWLIFPSEKGGKKCFAPQAPASITRPCCRLRPPWSSFPP